MFPSLREGDRLLVERLTPRLRPAGRGELLLFADPQRAGRLLLKRLIGLPGERVELVGGRLLIDGAKADEPYRHHLDLWYGSTAFQLGDDELLLLGDNRSASRDSRHFGPVARRTIVGRAWYRYYPLERAGRLA
jgi:signal peptidase I